VNLDRNIKRLAELALGLVVVVCAVATVYAKHESRKLYAELQVLQRERDQFEMEWGQLQIEQSTWSTHARVERMAREEIGMGEPLPEQLRMLP
jgi:cell division protein FtsL